MATATTARQRTLLPFVLVLPLVPAVSFGAAGTALPSKRPQLVGMAGNNRGVAVGRDGWLPVSIRWFAD